MFHVKFSASDVRGAAHTRTSYSFIHLRAPTKVEKKKAIPDKGSAHFLLKEEGGKKGNLLFMFEISFKMNRIETKKLNNLLFLFSGSSCCSCTMKSRFIKSVLILSRLMGGTLR